MNKLGVPVVADQHSPGVNFVFCRRADKCESSSLVAEHQGLSWAVVPLTWLGFLQKAAFSSSGSCPASALKGNDRREAAASSGQSGA